MSKVCKYCGKELPTTWSTDSCLECSKQRVRELFKQDPQLEQAFKESIAEMRKPENLKKMAEDTVKVFNVLNELRKKSR